MKRFIPFIFSFAILIGTLAPVTLSLTQNKGIELLPTRASAQTTTPPTAGAASTTPGVPASPTVTPGVGIDDCGIQTLTSCITWVFYYVPYDLGDWAMSLAAEAFDAAASFTLSSKLFTTNSSNFLTQGWSITRDFANIFFILILLLVALSLVLGMDIGHANPKTMFGMVIIVAILINFSFFMTEVVIDISNSLALVFYNQISVVDKSKNPVPNTAENNQLAAGGSQYITTVKPLSIALVSSFEPQVLSSPTFYQKLAAVGTTNFFSNANGTSANKVPATTMIPFLIIIGLMYLVVAYSFIVALIALLGRLINLFIAIVFAPLAFVSLVVPSARDISGFGWDEWFSDLMTNAFAAPIYFFLLLLASLLSQISILPTDTSKLLAMSPGIIILLIMIQFGIVVTLLLKATSYMKKSSGRIGELISKSAGKLGGFAVGTVSGVVAFAGSTVIGNRANQTLNDKNLQNRAAGIGTGKVGQAIAKMQLRQANWLAKSSFDARHIKPLNELAGNAGIDTRSILFNSKNSAGGRQARVARKAAKDQEFMELFRTDEKRRAKIKKDREDREALLDEMKTEKNKKEADNKLLENTTEFKDLKDKVEMATKLRDNALRTKIPADILAAEKNLKDVKDEFGNFKKNITKNPIDIDFTANEARILELKKKMGDVEDGVRDGDGKKIRAKAGETKADGTVVSKDEADRVKMEHGHPVLDANKKKISEAPIKRESLSISDLKALEEGENTRLQRAYIHSVNKDTGFAAHATFDKLGNILESHVDKDKRGEFGIRRAISEGFKGAMAGAVLGTALAPLTFGLSSIAGAIAGGFAGLKIGGTAQGLQHLRGGSSEAADAAHHLVAKANDPHADHGKHDAHGDHHSPNTSFFNELKSIFSSKGGSGGGGGGGHH